MENSDRLRLLCRALGLELDELVKGMLAERNGVKDPPVEKVNAVRDTVRGWWNHVHQPRKKLEHLFSFLQAKASNLNVPFQVEELWLDKTLTPLQFAQRCGLDLATALNEISPHCKQAVVELTDSIPFIKELRNWEQFAPDHKRSLSTGTYVIYRVHSSKRRICREMLRVESRSNSLFNVATYVQYVDQDNKERPIKLSIFPVHKCTHAIGSYTDSAGRSDRNRKSGRQSLVHLIIFDNVFAGAYSGLLADLTDQDSAASAQRFLLRKIGDDVSSTDVHAHLVGSEDATRPEDEAQSEFKALWQFLLNHDADDYFLLANEARISQFWSKGLSDLS